jgi:hypothetical protein
MRLFTCLRKKFFKTTIVMAMTLQVINISIDPADQFTGAQDVAINEIESCVELVLEVILDHDGAIDETDEADDSTHGQSGSVIFFTVKTCSLICEKPYSIVSAKNDCDHFSCFTSLNLPILSPPPRNFEFGTLA